MRIFVRLLLLLSLVLAMGCSSSPGASSKPVYNDFVAWQLFNERAVWYSSTSRKPILIYFYTDDCMPCEQMSRHHFTNQNIVLTINNYFTPVRLDSQNKKTRYLMSEFGIQQVPAVVILSHVDRSVLSKMTGVPAPVLFFNNLKISLQMDRVKAIQGVMIGE